MALLRNETSGKIFAQVKQLKVKTQKISKRLLDIVDALPVKEGFRILEIGCGSGVVARELASRFNNIYIVGVDRSSKAIQQATKNSANIIKQGRLQFVQSEIEAFELAPGEKLFDLAFGIRVGALDGRHPEIERKALECIAIALKKNGKLFIDDGDPLKEIKLKRSMT